MTYNVSRIALGMAAVASLLVVPAMARIGMPVSLTLASADALQRGAPALVHVIIRSGVDMPVLNFQVLPSEDWQVVEGSQYWSGSAKKGEMVELRLKATPLTDNPAPLRASLRSLGFPDVVSSLDPERMGGRFPERGVVEEDGRPGRLVGVEEEPIQAEEVEPDVEPAAATNPRLPGRPAEEETEKPEPRKGKSRAAAVTVTATGRFVYVDDRGIQRGVRNATVELWDRNPAPSFGDALCVRGLTDGAGNFTLVGTCGDLFDGPDLFVRIVLNNNRVEVKPKELFAGSYAVQSFLLSNRPAGTTNFGTMTIPANLAAAFQTHNLITRAERLIRNAGESMSKVTVRFPGDATFYSPILDEIHIAAGLPFSEEGDIFHEYGHHVLSTKAESPAPNYDNGICDTPTPGHCIFSPENETIAWTEGWPNFYAQVLHNANNAADGYGATNKYSFDSNANLTNFGFDGQEDETEGFIAAILIDLFDSVEANASHQDAISLSFNALWNVVKNFDPSNDLFHNHPTNIHEYWSGLRSLQLNNINRISAVYSSLGINKPRPDLQMTAIQNAPAVVTRGASFSITNTVANRGSERANSGFTVRFQFMPVVGMTRAFATTVGSRAVGANMLAGASSAANTTLRVPTGATPGFYILRACADSGNAVPESNETNCISAGGSTEIR